MKDIKISVKLMVSFIIIAIIAAGVGIYTRSTIATLSEATADLYERGAQPLSSLINVVRDAHLLRMKVYTLTSYENQDPTSRNQIVSEADNLVISIRSGLDEQRKYLVTDKGKKLIDDYDRAVQEYNTRLKNFANDLNRSGNLPIPQDLKNTASNMENILDEFVNTKRDVAKSMDANSDKIEATAKSISAFATIMMIIFAIACGLFITHSITQPISALVELFKRAENGDMTARSGLNQRDEIGTVAHIADGFFIKLQGIIKELHMHSDTLAGASEELSAVSRQLASASEETVSQTTTVASTTEEMSVNINTMASGAEEASVNASEVASAAEEMSVNMDTISAAVEEMSVSISQISSNAGEAQKVATEATQKANEATVVMSKLGSAAKEIGHVTDVIKKIADKTNLLALNATIEAASAGEAGKGFAVVAGEIKELANQSAQSADDIAQRIEGIQGGTGDAVDVITRVSEIIQKINSSVEVITNNVSEQSRAVNEISSNVVQASTGAKRVASAIGEVANGANDVSRNAGEAAKGATHVASNVSSMSSVARESAQGAGQVNESSSDLSRMATELRGIVNQFRV